MGRKYIMIDGIDEVPTDNEERDQDYLLDLIRELATISNDQLHILIAGRDRPGGDIDTKLSSGLDWIPFTMVPDIISKDIGTFVQAKLQTSPFTRLSKDSISAIIDKLVGNDIKTGREHGM